MKSSTLSIDGCRKAEYRWMQKICKTVIAGCDASAHNIIWESSDNKDRCIALLAYLFTKDLTLANVDNKPTRYEGKFCTCFKQAINWKVIDYSPLLHKIPS